YDLLVSSFPHYVSRFRAAGLRSTYLRLAFEPRVLARLPHDPPRADAAFVGSYTPAHHDGIRLLEGVARHVPVAFWGAGVESLDAASPIRASYRGEAWGLAMYGVLAGARVALNRHINVAGPFANNMRLYEATGVGACLLTDRKANLGELFEVGREVVAYGSAEECAEQLRYLLDHEDERRAIAAAGQARTLREHTYAQRMEELAALLEAGLRRPSAPPVVFALGRARARLREALGRGEVSDGYRPIAAEEAGDLARGWQSARIPARQRRLVEAQLRRLRAGDAPPVFRVAAEAVHATGVPRPLIVELGCASAYYSEALPALLGAPVRYVGLDYAAALLRQARSHYPGLPLACAEATGLPLADSCCDIAFSSGLILHVPDYRRAIVETARVARAWCIFHRTPVAPGARTVALAKAAYGVPVVELVFGEDELLGLLAAAGLTVVETYLIERYQVPGAPGEVALKTYLCRKGPADAAGRQV
ncbi:MAG TPA: glycosyltransferase, partial [Chloroflexaceae bacterium]|nr:glycosyltransferase [Chloroflexaceae bacterium]